MDYGIRRYERIKIKKLETREMNFEFGICNLECKRIQNKRIRDSLRLRDWEMGLGGMGYVKKRLRN